MAIAGSPTSDVPSIVPIQSTAPVVCFFATASQSTSRKMNGHDAAIHPIVPQTRTGPNSRVGSFKLANAIELVIEMVGT